MGFSQRCHGRTILSSTKNLSEKTTVLKRMIFSLCEEHFISKEPFVQWKGSIDVKDANKIPHYSLLFLPYL